MHEQDYGSAGVIIRSHDGGSILADVERYCDPDTGEEYWQGHLPSLDVVVRGENRSAVLGVVRAAVRTLP